MKDTLILIAGIALIMPFAVLIVAANMRLSQARHLKKLKVRADVKKHLDEFKRKYPSTFSSFTKGPEVKYQKQESDENS